MKSTGIFLLLLALPGAGQSPGFDAAALDAALQEVRAAQGIPAVSCAVAFDGAIRYARAFGYADLENDVPADPETVFRTASIAKPLTAVAAMRLAHDGKLDLDRPIGGLIPSLPEKPWSMTVRQLLGHQGGVRHYKGGAEARGTRYYPTLEASLGNFKNDPLVAEPGTRFVYTTYGYTLIGRAIEEASGESFAAFMQAVVWEPAGMTRTRVDTHFQLIKNRARGYQRPSARNDDTTPEDGSGPPAEVHNAHLHDTSMKVPGGGIVSTSSDLTRFGLALLEDRLLPRSVRDTMWTVGKTQDGKTTGYGLGFRVGSRDGHPVISHSGGQAGTSTLLVIHPGSGVVVALMTNLRGARLGPLAATAAALADAAR
jgi:CubicO group peptidase (beta-lactamase class C family)